MCGNKNKPTYITHRSIQFHWKKLMMRIVEASMRIFAAMPHLWLLPQGFGLHINDLRGNIWTAANGWYRPTWRGWVAPQYGPLDKHQDAWHTSKRRISRDVEENSSWVFVLKLLNRDQRCFFVRKSHPHIHLIWLPTSPLPRRTSQCAAWSEVIFVGPEVSSRASSKTALKNNPSVYKVKACKLCFACIILVLYNPNWWANMFGFP